MGKPKPEYDAVRKILIHLMHQDPNPKAVTAILNICRDIDLHPLEVVANRLAYSPKINIFAWCRWVSKNRGVYIGKYKTYNDFINTLVFTPNPIIADRIAALKRLALNGQEK